MEQLPHCPHCKKHAKRHAAICSGLGELIDYLGQVRAHAIAQIRTGHHPRGTWVHWRTTADVLAFVINLLESLRFAGCQKIV